MLDCTANHLLDVCWRLVAAIDVADHHHRVNEVRKAICFELDLGKELTARLVVPNHVGSTQAGDEAFDVLTGKRSSCAAAARISSVGG